MTKQDEKSKLLGVDIGGTKVLTIVTDKYGDILYSEKHPVNHDINNIINSIKQVIAHSQINYDEIIGIGVGVPAIVNVETGDVVQMAALNWEPFNLAEIFRCAFKLPIWVENDVNCAAIGEKWKGSASGMDDFYFMAIGTGFGSAIVSNGQLIHGFKNRAGEVGYNMTSKEFLSGKTNNPEAFGCFESRISGTGLKTEKWTAEQTFEKYKTGSVKATKIIEEFTLELGIFIGNTVNLLNPESVIIGGGVSRSMSSLIPSITEIANRVSPSPFTLKLASLGEEAGAIGAASLVYINS